MTLPRAFDLMGAWKDSPPVHWMIAGYLGIGKNSENKSTKAPEQSLSGLADIIPISRGKKRSLEDMVSDSLGITGA